MPNLVQRALPRVALPRVALACVLIGAAWPVAALAQALSDPNKAPTSPTANDASVGISQSPATMSSTPVARTPDLARKEGAGDGPVPDANTSAKDKR